MKHNLPHILTPFIGRETEIEAILDRLDHINCQLLTLVGPGGSGKTRLAIEVARHSLNQFPDGAYFVNLQPVRSPSRIVATIIDALNIQLSGGQDPLEQLINNLRERQLLLILDNFEQLLVGASLVTTLIENAPHLKVLVTSREVLNIQVEWVWEVRGLTYPKQGQTETPENYSAIQLFEVCAHRVKSDFVLNEQVSGVTRVCQLVRGIPLAIELAASWSRTLSSDSIADQIQHNIDFLMARHQDMPDRHRSTRAVFNHSWQLLSPAEQASLCRLSVFRGGFDQPAAEQVAAATLLDLASLVDKSLVHRQGDHRYDLHELTRQFAYEKLEEADYVLIALKAHCDYYTQFMQQRAAALNRCELSVIDEVARDFQNVHAAWDRALELGNFDNNAQMLPALGRFCIMRSRWQEFEPMLTAGIDAIMQLHDDRHAPLLSVLLMERGDVLNFLGRYQQAEADLERGLSSARQQQDTRSIAKALWVLGLLKQVIGQPDAALAMVMEGVEAARQHGNPQELGYALNNAAIVAENQGQLQLCRDYVQECLNIRREIGDQHGIGHVLWIFGLLEQRMGRWTAALDYLQQALKQYQLNSSGLYFQAHCHGLISLALFFQGDFDNAADHAEQARSLAREISDPDNQLIGLTVMTLTAYGRKDLIQVTQWLAALDAIRHPNYPKMGRTLTEIAYAWLLVNRQQFDSAANALAHILDTALNAHATGDLLLAVLASCPVLLHYGKPMQAAEHIGSIAAHPAQPTKLFSDYHPLIALRSELETVLGTSAYAAAVERGSNHDLEQAAARCLDRLRRESSDTVSAANQSLPDPLTPRELEVLGLLARDMSNPQIAERLTITIGTVKSYTNKIYSKLTVENRAQAVDRARELHLL